MEICAVRFPDAVGLKLRLRKHELEANNVLPDVQEELEIENSDALAPVIEVAPRMTFELVPFATVTFWKPVEPTLVEKKFTGLGEATIAAAPVPVKLTSTGLPDGPVKTMCRVAERAAAAPGVKVMPKVQVPPGAAVVLLVEQKENEFTKSLAFVPVTVALVRLRVEVVP